MCHLFNFRENCLKSNLLLEEFQFVLTLDSVENMNNNLVVGPKEGTEMALWKEVVIGSTKQL